MNYPKITIVIPTYNRSKYLENTILSILNQNYPNIELIIIDGGSSVDTLTVIKKYESYITYWESEKDNGMYHAIQKGFDKSTGVIMAWLNSDDLYQNNALKTVANIFTDLKHVEWITGMPSFFNNEGECVKISTPIYRSFNHFLIGDYKWIQQESTFWRRELWEKSGSQLSNIYKLAADCELWFRFFKCCKLYYVETSLAGFRLHGEQLSVMNEQAYLNEAELIYKSFVLNKDFTLKQRFTKLLFNLKSTYFINDSNIGVFLNSLIKFLLKSKIKIYFNFETNKWQSL